MNELGDVLLTVTSVTTLDVADKLARTPAAVRVRELERPEEAGRLLEVGSASGDLVDQVLDACEKRRGRQG